MQTAQFQLANQRAKINGVNVRSELHGTDHVAACDISFTVKMSNDALAFFDPALKGAMYAKEAGQAKQGDLVGGISNMPVLRFPMLGMPLQWDWSGAGYDLIVNYGVTGQAIRLVAEIDKFRIGCLDGGTVEITFRAQAHPEEAQIGRLCTFIQCEVDITLDPPRTEPMKTNKDLLDERKSNPTEDKPKRGRGAAREKAEEAFE